MINTHTQAPGRGSASSNHLNSAGHAGSPCLLDCYEDTFSGFLLTQHGCSAQTQYPLCTQAAAGRTGHNANKRLDKTSWLLIPGPNISLKSGDADVNAVLHVPPQPHDYTSHLKQNCCGTFWQQMFSVSCLLSAAAWSERTSTRPHLTLFFTKYILKGPMSIEWCEVFVLL